MLARDPGVQNERTALAWQRTALSMMAASIAATRLAYGAVGPLALADLLVALPLSAAVLWVSRVRYRKRAGLNPAAPWSTGLIGALLVASLLVVAAIELAALV